jgi:surface antigen
VRTRNLKRLRAIVSAVVLSAMGVALVASPAMADTTLCSGFSACATAGYTDHGYSAHRYTSYWGAVASTGDNCTNYAAYTESTVNGVQSPGNNLGNASQWASTAAAKGIPVDHTPMRGAVAQWGSADHVSYVEDVRSDGSLVLSDDSYPSGPFRWYVVPSGSSNWPNYFIHFNGTVSNPGSYADGTFVRASDTGRVYTMAGGSPMYVSSLSNVPWTGSYVSLTQSQIDNMPMYPADGTAIRGYTSGGIYVVAGGFPFGVSSLGNIPNNSWTEVDANTISNGLRSQPADGTVIRNYTSGSIYVVSGDAPMPVHSLSAIPYASWTNIDGWAIANQMRTYPTDGSTFVDYSTGTVYVVAGGAPMATNSFANIPPVTSLPYVDDWAVTNYLPAYPADGTVIRDYSSGSISVVAGGSALGISSLTHVPYQSWVNIDGTYAVSNQLRSYPASGTYIRGYQSQEEFVSNGTTISRVTATPLPAATAVDDWAITNQLGGTL